MVQLLCPIGHITITLLLFRATAVNFHIFQYHVIFRYGKLFTLPLNAVKKIKELIVHVDNKSFK